MAKFTAEQQAAIDAQGRTIVSASAGSGKTTVMIEKIIRLIKSGCNVGEILAVTFTKKAAAQMKEKLCKALIEGINQPDCDAERRSMLKKQLSEVPSADISTIHSFCSKLIKIHFYAAGVDNGFRIIGGDDAEGIALKNAALDELLEEGYEERTPQFSHLLSVYWRKKSDRALRGILLTAYDELRNRADYKEFLNRSSNYDESLFDRICLDLKKKLDEKCRYYAELLEDEHAYFMDEGGTAQVALSDELLEWLNAFISAKDYFAASRVEKPKFSTNRSSKKDSDEKRRHIERLSYLKTRMVKIYEDELLKTLTREEELARFLRSGETAGALAAYLLRFDEKYSALKLERGVLDYNDLEHKALALLQNEEVAKEVREKYRYVFVDEYQDVNPVQEAIVSRISGENLFLVGDVKQSIYGFRGSKSRFFVEKQQEFEEGNGNNLAMTRNFRSSDQVLDAVNSQFSLAMTPRVCNVDYARDSRMERGGRYALNDGRVCVHILGKEEKKHAENRGVYSVRENTGKAVMEESALAKSIRSIIEGERRARYYDPDTQEYREVRYSDIAVLSRKKQGQIGATVASLSAEGLPVSAAAAVNICEFSEIKTLTDILSLLDNAEQDVPLCSALLSTLGNLTADDLTDIRLAYKGEVFFRNACRLYAEEQTDEIAYKLRKFYERFYEYRKLAGILSAGELLTKILSETNMETQLLKRKNGVACLRRIHRFLEESTQPEPLCVHEFLERLRALDYKIEYSENGGEDSVKVLTMHSSKGLEYPIVILDNLSAPFRGVDHDEVLVEETYGLAPRAFDSEKMTKSSTLLRRLYEVKEQENLIADELNLYYVALTRAKYGLHMIFDARTPIADVKYARSFAEFTDFSVWEQYVVDDEPFDLPKQERAAMAAKPNGEVTEKILEAMSWNYPYAGCENLPVKSSATALLQTAEVETDAYVRPLFDASEGEERKKIGTAYHGFLERFDFALLYDEKGEPIDKAALVEEIEKLYQEEKERGMVETNLLSVEKLVEILSNPIFKELYGMRLYKERQFITFLSVKDVCMKTGEDLGAYEAVGDEEIIFQGAIDLLAVGDNGEVRIIDYKFSKGGAEYLREHYRAQLELYKLATAKILKMNGEKIRCTVVNIDRGFQVDVE